VSARYFFGAAVSNADVKYYVYRSRYYPWPDYEDEESDEEDEGYAEYGDYSGDMVSEGGGKLDASGRLQIDFDVPQHTENDVFDFQYRLEAQVTDASRRTISRNSASDVRIVPESASNAPAMVSVRQ